LERDAVNASATHLFGVVSVMVKEEEIALGQRSVFKSYSAICMKEFRTRPTNSQQVSSERRFGTEIPLIVE